MWDQCGCYLACGNVEGKFCDLDRESHVYGQCGHHLISPPDVEKRVDGTLLPPSPPHQPWGICVNQESGCGPEGNTPENVCQFKEPNLQKSSSISRKHKGSPESGNTDSSYHYLEFLKHKEYTPLCMFPISDIDCVRWNDERACYFFVVTIGVNFQVMWPPTNLKNSGVWTSSLQTWSSVL